MAGNERKKKGGQDKRGGSHTHENLPDELDLRDEIFELKKEIVKLRKEREKLVITVRKSYEESKKKDKQIEQLMDPSQKRLAIEVPAVDLPILLDSSELEHLIWEERPFDLRQLLGRNETYGRRLLAKAESCTPLSSRERGMSFSTSGQLGERHNVRGRTDLHVQSPLRSEEGGLCIGRIHPPTNWVAFTHLTIPGLNSEIRRLLSMKGAAILLNLKDENNALVHMVMEKDLHIRRLTAEIKTAKLYSRSSKTEPYRAEIGRLRSLLLQSQEALKEAAAGPYMPSLQTHVDSTSSSLQPTPRQLEELRFTVQSLETHMRYSKQLLSKKNQEIFMLSQQLENIVQGHQKFAQPEQVNLMKGNLTDFSKKTFVFDNDNERGKILDIFRSSLPKSMDKALTEPKLNKPEKATKRNSLPSLYTGEISLKKVAGVKNVSINESECVNPETAEMFSKSLNWKNGKCKDSLTDVMELAGGSVDGKSYGAKNITLSGKQKWRKALRKYRKSCSLVKNEIETDGLKMEKTDVEGNFMGKSKKRIVVSNKASDEEVWGVLRCEILKNPSLESEDLIVSTKLSSPTSLGGEIQSQVKREEPPIPKRRTKISNSELDKTVGDSDEIITLEEMPAAPVRQKVFRSLYRPSIDSSLDSENGSISRLVPKSFEVEVEINNPRESFESESSTPLIGGFVGKDGGESFFDDDNFNDDDDDDVITV